MTRFRSFLIVFVLLLTLNGVIRPATAAVSIQNFFPFGSSNGDSLVPGADDAFESVRLRYPFSFFNQTYSEVFVNVNGAISFQQGVTQFTPTCGSTPVPMITPFWGDVDTRGGQGVISYRETLDKTMLQKANREVLQAFPDFHDLSVGWLFIATWSEVGFYGASASCSGTSLRNTYQLALTTDGTHSFVIVYYNKLSWTTGTASSGTCDGLGGTPAKAGFDVGDQKTFYQMPGSCTSGVREITERSNIGQSGKWVFRVDNALRAAKGCSDEPSKLKIKPTFVSMMGSVPIKIRGPCLADAIQATCVFEDSRESGVPGIISKDKEFVTCMVPFLYSAGRLRLDLIVKSNTKTITHSGFIYTTDAEEDMKNFKIVAEPDGDVTMSFTWDPNYFSYSNDDKPVPAGRSKRSTAARTMDVAPSLNLKKYQFDGQKWVPAGTIQANITNSGSFKKRIARSTIDSVAPTRKPNKPSVTTISLTAPGSTGKKTSHLMCPQSLRSPADNLKECLAWYEKDKGPPTDFQPCPPTERQANEDGRFQKDNSPIRILQTFHPGAESVFRQRVPSTAGSGSECVYKNGKILIGPMGGGSVAMSSPGTLRMTPMHFLNDISPWCACCGYSNDASACRKYYEKRPSDAGTNYAPRRIARAVGDPHITTFKDLTYTFNGVGEYWMVKSPEFMLQARMEQFETTQASVFTAFVMEQLSSASVNEPVRAQIFVKEAGKIGLFLDDELMDLEESVAFDFKGLSISLEYPAKITLDFSSGFSFVFSTGGGAFLNIISSASSEQMGKLAGLMGDYDGKIENDLTAPDGTKMNSKTSNLQEIHYQFGLKWMITAPESLFRYSSGKSYSTYQNINFVPNFNIPQLSDIPENVKALCNSSRECMFDYATTGSLEVAATTKEEVLAFEEKIEAANIIIQTCEPPVSPENGYVNATNFFQDSRIRFGCEEGFELIGNERLTCVMSKGGLKWNGNIPSCTAVNDFEFEHVPIVVDGAMYCPCTDENDDEAEESVVNFNGAHYCPCLD